MPIARPARAAPRATWVTASKSPARCSGDQKDPRGERHPAAPRSFFAHPSGSSLSSRRKENEMTTKKGVMVAAAVAGLFATVGGPFVKAARAGAGDVACTGVNECKGKGSCKGGENGCKGKNSCKGKGITMMPEKD